MKAVLGAAVTDTIETRLAQPLVVEVRNSKGAAVPGVLVRFDARMSSDPMRFYLRAVVVCALNDPECGDSRGPRSTVTAITDSRGRARATVWLGRIAGRSVIDLTVPSLRLADSAVFTVLPGALTGVRPIAPDTSVDIGGTATLKGFVVDRYLNARAEVASLTAGAGTVLSLNAETGVVTGLAMGTQWLFTRYASFVDSTLVGVVPSARLVVWNSTARVLRLVNLNGTGLRQIAVEVASDLGAFPRFDATRQR